MAPEEQARWLADQEARRIAQARLFYLGDDAADTAIVTANGIDGRPFLLDRSMPPAEHGFMVWSHDVSATARGADVIACHWHARDDGVWVGWWIDFASNTRTKMAAAGYDTSEAEALINEIGLLSHHRNALLPYGNGTITVNGTEPGMSDRIYALSQTTITSWVILSDTETHTRVLAAPPGPITGLDPLPGTDDTVTIVMHPPAIT